MILYQSDFIDFIFEFEFEFEFSGMVLVSLLFNFLIIFSLPFLSRFYMNHNRYLKFHETFLSFNII